MIFVFLFNSSVEAKPFGLRVAGNYSSQQMYRGAVTWPEPVAFVGPMLVFYERVFLAGPNLWFNPTNRKDQLQWRTGFAFNDDDDPPFSLGDHEEDYRNRRKSTLEWNAQVSYNFGYRNKFQIGALFAREIKEDYGVHTEFFGTTPFLPFTTIEARVSFTEKQLSQNIYGPEAVSGEGFASLGINGVIPFVPWDGIITLNYTRFWVLQQQNISADYIRGDDQNDVFTLRFFWNAY